jgi:Tfp pilus assembly major pilin PilA
MELRSIFGTRQHGLSMIGFLFVIVIIALVAVVAMKVVPTVVEFAAVKKAIVTARDAGNSAREIQLAFEKARNANYVESVEGKDLDIVKTADGFDVSVAYEKRIPLVGPVSLVIDYVATTSNQAATKKLPQ